ncbi:MAG: BLUF domain-containing protein, partial [Gammaproteobacteria bacterium]
MHLVVYTSEYVGRKEDINSVLDDIVKTSKINNPAHEITGLLFYHNQRFIQVLEGEREALEELMSILEKDHRHKNIQRILDQPIKKRGFMDWNMDSCNLSEDQDIEPEELIRIR